MKKLLHLVIPLFIVLFFCTVAQSAVVNFDFTAEVELFVSFHGEVTDTMSVAVGDNLSGSFIIYLDQPFIDILPAENSTAYNEIIADLVIEGLESLSRELPSLSQLGGLTSLNITIVEDTIPVSIDVEPQICPNSINARSKGGLSLAILGSSDLDVSKIDPTTVQLQGVSPVRWTIDDVAAPYHAGSMDICDIYACNTIPYDGYLDLNLKFATQDVMTALETAIDGDCLMLMLTGNLKNEFGGTPIAGWDVAEMLKKN